MKELLLPEIEIVSGGTRLETVVVTGTRPRTDSWEIRMQMEALSPPDLYVPAQLGSGGGGVTSPSATATAQQAIIDDLEENYGEYLDFSFDESGNLIITADHSGWVDLTVNGVRDGVFDPSIETAYFSGDIVNVFTNPQGDAISDQINAAFAASVAEIYIPFNDSYV
ncbi:MAG: hypothetical protein MRY64_15535 [Hyphomonadaceae bacterium]|nr:hypothetical protein [Hyphomonadaceae bacterium]